MGNIAIQVENLGKRYRLGVKVERYYSLRDNLVQAVKSPLQKLQRLGNLTIPDNEIFWALKDISFKIEHGEVLGIIGRNGAGKSTLLKVLSRITEPTTGHARVYGRIGSLLEVGTGFHPELTGRENIFLSGAVLGMRKAEIERKFDEIVDFAGIEQFLDTPAKRYSSGMYVRLAFAVAAHLEPEILLVDEVLAVGDSEFQKKCLRKMGDVATAGRTVVLVSHNMAAIQNLCQTSIVLNSGELIFDGATSDCVKYYMQSLTNVARTDLSKRLDRKGSQWLKFVRVGIYDLEGNEIQQAVSGKDVFIRLYYESQKEMHDANVSVSFNVRSSQGYLLTNLHSVDTGNSILEIYKKGYFECHWPNFNLRSGIYDCNLWCAVNREIVDWMQNAFAINVEDGDFHGTGKMVDRSQGDVLVDHQWSCGVTPNMPLMPK